MGGKRRVLHTCVRMYDRGRHVPAKILRLADGGYSSAGERLNITVPQACFTIVLHSVAFAHRGPLSRYLGLPRWRGVSVAADVEACYEIKKGTRLLCKGPISFPCRLFSSGVFSLGA